jgi:LacI family transcriptional regulator
MAVRMKDIAQDLGVSLVTVSKVLHNHKDISQPTRDRVLRRMKELNYKPSLHAQGLASGKSLMVGLIVPDLVYAFFAETAKSLAGVLRKEGYGLLIASSDEDPEIEKQEIEQMLRRQVDALLLASCQSDPDSLLKVAENKIPYILVDRKFAGHSAHFAGTNDLLIGELATEHLIKIGRRKIAHIGGQKISTSLGRLQGYRKALLDNRIHVPAEYVITRDKSDESGDVTGYQAMQKLLRLKPRPDAVFCYNDPAAVGAMNAILDAGLRIPEDIAVVGAGNLRYSDSFRVSLTSVDVSSKVLGENAGNLALQLMNSKVQLRPKSTLVKPKLVIRQSTTVSH